MWSEATLERLREPRFLGRLEHPTCEALAGSRESGHFFSLQLQVEQGRIAAVAYRTFGCAVAIACGSLMAERALGKTVDEAREIGAEQLLAELGPIPATRTFCIGLALEALHTCLSQGADDA